MKKVPVSCASACVACMGMGFCADTATVPVKVVEVPLDEMTADQVRAMVGNIDKRALTALTNAFDHLDGAMIAPLDKKDFVSLMGKGDVKEGTALSLYNQLHKYDKKG